MSKAYRNRPKFFNLWELMVVGSLEFGVASLARPRLIPRPVEGTPKMPKGKGDLPDFSTFLVRAW